MLEKTSTVLKVTSLLAALCVLGSVAGAEPADAKSRHRGDKVARHIDHSKRSVSGSQHGIASYYWQGQRTATGERFNPGGLTAAHRTLPFGTVVRVTNQRNGSSVHVRINDRGPYVRGRVIDLSRAAAHRIGMASAGLAPVTVQVVN